MAVEVTPQMARKLLEAVVGRMRDVVARGGQPGEVAAARLAEAEAWGFVGAEELESSLQAVASDAYLRSMLALYRDFAARAEKPPVPVAVAAAAACERAAERPAQTLNRVGAPPEPMSEEERRRKLASWHDSAADPEVLGREATWAVPHWRETCELARLGEGIWSEEFFCAGRCGLRLGVFPRGHKEGRSEMVSIVVSGPRGDEFDAVLEAGGLEREERLSLSPLSSGISAPTIAGWLHFAAAEVLKPDPDGSLPILFRIE